MRRIAVSIAALALCAGCASAPGGYAPVGGVASYDALKAARDACVSKGGELVQQAQTSGQSLDDYACKRK
jgi:hypothetical protein